MTSGNFWPILVASIVAMGIGALWYSPLLFGKEWMKLMNIKEAEIAAARKRGMVKLYAGQFVMTLVTFAVLTFILVNTASRTTGDGVLMGFLVWLGFGLPSGVSALLWENKPFKLILITSLANLVTMVIGGAIIGAW